MTDPKLNVINALRAALNGAAPQRQDYTTDQAYEIAMSDHNLQWLYARYALFAVEISDTATVDMLLAAGEGDITLAGEGVSYAPRSADYRRDIWRLADTALKLGEQHGY